MLHPAYSPAAGSGYWRRHAAGRVPACGRDENALHEIFDGGLAIQIVAERIKPAVDVGDIDRSRHGFASAIGKPHAENSRIAGIDRNLFDLGLAAQECGDGVAQLRQRFGRRGRDGLRLGAEAYFREKGLEHVGVSLMCRVRISCRRRQDQGEVGILALLRWRKRRQPPGRRPKRVAGNRIHAARFRLSFMHVVPRSRRDGGRQQKLGQSCCRSMTDEAYRPGEGGGLMPGEAAGQTDERFDVYRLCSLTQFEPSRMRLLFSADFTRALAFPAYRDQSAYCVYQAQYFCRIYRISDVEDVAQSSLANAI
ncbi:hypothetical protein [Rhizobium leguminosarum]|uniref:hypothetical protein n=1 Tax=Rhizobium leguminosarum TaxID=384 RepID=UPI0021BBF97C|nr:hypothetical protein [Rhizobium leguminosarum]